MSRFGTRRFAPGHDIDLKAVRDQIGKGGDILVPSLFPDADEALTKTLSDEHGDNFKATYLVQMLPFPEARTLLVRAHLGGQKVVFASSASQVELDHYLGLLDARGIVAATTSIDDVESSKPAPDIFAAAQAEGHAMPLEQAAREALHVDSPV